MDLSGYSKMRKGLERDEPDIRWTDQELLAWVKKNGVLDEAHTIRNQDQSVSGVSGSFKRAE